jgi:hypothetical protein
MPTRTARSLILTLGAALLLASAVSTASARNLSINNQNIRVTFTSLEFGASEIIVRCLVTLEGSFHTRTLAKVARSLVGAITKAAVKQETCTGGSGGPFNGVERYNGTTSPNTLPWHLTYDSFQGTLPNITSLRAAISRFRFGARDASAICTGEYGNETDAIVAQANREAGGAITELSPVAGSNRETLARRDGGILCPESATMLGRASVMQLGTTTRLTITLI